MEEERCPEPRTVFVLLCTLACACGGVASTIFAALAGDAIGLISGRSGLTSLWNFKFLVPGVYGIGGTMAFAVWKRSWPRAAAALFLSAGMMYLARRFYDLFVLGITEFSPSSFRYLRFGEAVFWSIALVAFMSMYLGARRKLFVLAGAALILGLGDAARDPWEASVGAFRIWFHYENIAAVAVMKVVMAALFLAPVTAALEACAFLDRRFAQHLWPFSPSSRTPLVEPNTRYSGL